MNLIERLWQCPDVNHARLQPVGGPPECLMPMALRDELASEIERLTAQVERMREALGAAKTMLVQAGFSDRSHTVEIIADALSYRGGD